MHRSLKDVKEIVTIQIVAANKKDWYYDMVGNYMIVIISNKSRKAICRSQLDFGNVMEIEDGHFKVVKGKDIRNIV